MKLLTHKWKVMPGFKTYQCSYCGCVKKWDNSLQRFIYSGNRYRANECKRIYHNDKIMI